MYNFKYHFMNSGEYVKSITPYITTTCEGDAASVSFTVESLADFDAAEIAEKVWEDLDKLIDAGETLKWTVVFSVNGEEACHILTDDSSVGAMIRESVEPEFERIFRKLTKELSEYIAAKAMAFAASKLYAKLDSVGEVEDSEDALKDFVEKVATKAKVTITKPTETLADYICDCTLREELQEIRDFVEQRSEYIDLGIKLPKGILFKGIPGTGKTYAARCIAGSCDCYFMSCTASSLQGMYVGSGAENVKNVFSCAKALFEKTSKAVIVFLDELDSFGSRERHGGNAGSEEDRTLNQLLAEMSGFEDSEGIIVMGATNYPERIDDALMRSGRFSRQITIGTPDEYERIALVEYYFAKLKMGHTEDCEPAHVAELSAGLTPADIAEVINESAILAIRGGDKVIGLEHINEAINRVITKNIRKPDKGHEFHALVAVHEAGHALAEALYRDTCPIKVTNYSYGDAGGFTQTDYSDDGILTREEYKNNVMVKLGGRAAEDAVFGEISTGASEDFARAKHSIRAYFEVYHFESYDVERLDQLVQDTLLAWYYECRDAFLEPETFEKLNTLADTLAEERILYKKDLCKILK